jgi:hypothetical protein
MKLSHQIKKYIWWYSFLSSIAFTLIVMVLGIISPDYNHLQNTISELAVVEYGWLQTFNFLQFGLGAFFFGLLLSTEFTLKESKRLWLLIFTLSSFMSVAMALFPTDRIGQLIGGLNQLSLEGTIHIGGVFTIFILFPFGVHALSKSLAREQQLALLSRFTAIIGYAVSMSCYIWTIFLLSNLFTNYLGLFQKLIAALCIYWMVTMLFAAKPTQS